MLTLILCRKEWEGKVWEIYLGHSFTIGSLLRNHFADQRQSTRAVERELERGWRKQTALNGLRRREYSWCNEWKRVTKPLHWEARAEVQQMSQLRLFRFGLIAFFGSWRRAQGVWRGAHGVGRRDLGRVVSSGWMRRGEQLPIDHSVIEGFIDNYRVRIIHQIIQLTERGKGQRECVHSTLMYNCKYCNVKIQK